MSDPYAIAAWRFEQIAPLTDPTLSPAQRRSAWRRLTGKAVVWPGSQARQRRALAPLKKPIPKSTLYRWLKAFRRHGYTGLIPKRRADRGASRNAGAPAWIGYAIGLLYEQPERSLTQLELYLKLEFDDYQLSRSSLARHLRAHPAFAGIDKLRKAKPSKLRALYEAHHPHESWQLDGKGPFSVSLQDRTRLAVHVLSILDDHSRCVLGTVIAMAEDTTAALRVFEKSAAKWGLADRFQFDRGSAFESKAFRHGLAQLGIHRNAVKPRSPESQGKIEAYHRCLSRWFVVELRAQQIVDLAHLEQLLEATIALLYNRHLHREIGATPEQRLANRLSARQVSLHDLQRAFFAPINAKSHPKTGEVRLPNGHFRVPAPFAGQRARFLYHPGHANRAVLLSAEDREFELEVFGKKPLPAPHTPASATGQLQKLLDQWRGHERPNAQPGFGLPEVFRELSAILGRLVPDSQREARHVLAFYRRHGPLPREPFRAACTRTANTLGPGRPLGAVLEHLERQIVAQRPSPPDTNAGDEP